MAPWWEQLPEQLSWDLWVQSSVELLAEAWGALLTESFAGKRRSKNKRAVAHLLAIIGKIVFSRKAAKLTTFFQRVSWKTQFVEMYCVI
jgi:hypothetical protein